MILTNEAIKEAINEGDIYIENFDESRLGPNSYNLTLGNKLLVYDEAVLDAKMENRVREIEIPESGLILRPGIVYLGTTNEYTETYNYVPMLSGRSSIGRLGISVHITAGLGQTGFSGRWTLELAATQLVKIYPNMEIAQIYYHVPHGENNMVYSGKYQHQETIASSKMYEEL